MFYTVFQICGCIDPCLYIILTRQASSCITQYTDVLSLQEGHAKTGQEARDLRESRDSYEGDGEEEDEEPRTRRQVTTAEWRVKDLGLS